MNRSALLIFAACLGIAGFAAGPARGQDVVPVANRHYQIKYQVPVDWQATRHVADSLALTRYQSPDGNTRLWVGQLRGAHRHVPPARALRRLLRHLGATRHEEHRVSAHGLDYLESTGTCRVDGRELRYDARVANHQGHVLVVYVYATPERFAVQEPLLNRLLDSVTPWPARPTIQP